MTIPLPRSMIMDQGPFDMVDSDTTPDGGTIELWFEDDGPKIATRSLGADGQMIRCRVFPNIASADRAKALTFWRGVTA